MKYKAVTTKRTAAMQRTTNGVVWKIKNVSLDCVSARFFGIFWPQTEVFQMTENT